MQEPIMFTPFASYPQGATLLVTCLSMIGIAPR